MTKRLTPIALFGMLLLSACGGGGGAAAPASNAPAGGSSVAAKASGAPSTPEQLAAYQGSDRQQILEAGAKKEGSISWYTTLAGPIIDIVSKDFEAKYPGVKVDVFRGDESTIMTRAIQESQANKPVFDVVEATPTTILLMQDGKLVTPYFSPSASKLPNNLKTAGANGLTAAAIDRLSYIGFGYNTKLIPADVVPKKVEDLMNPALTGKLTLAGSTTGQRWAASVLHLMGDDKGKQWLSDFAAKQKPKVQQMSGKAVLDLIGKGEIPGSPTIFLDHVDQGKAAGEPVEWVPIEPVVGNAGEVAFDSKAPHPNAGLLFADYLLGPGQEVYKKNNVKPATEQVPFKFWIPEQGKTAKQVEQDAKTWADLFKSDFR